MDEMQNTPQVESLIIFNLRDIFEDLANKKPEKIKYFFITDDPFFAENLISETYFTIFITKEPDPNSFTVDEFHTFINTFGKAAYSRDYFYIPVCTKTRNEELRRVLKKCYCKYSHSGWQAFSLGPDYFKNNLKELEAAAQGVIDKINGKGKQKKKSCRLPTTARQNT